MQYKHELGIEMGMEFEYYPKEQQDAIITFLTIYSNSGLEKFSKYIGKISPSWKNLSECDPIYQYTKSNHLWHAHIGLPEYCKSQHHNYYTSDMILHFMWKNQGNYIKVVDITEHYKADGTFWLPTEKYLK